VRLRQAHQAFPGPVHQPGVGRERDRLLLDRGVHDHLPEVGGFGSPGAGRDRKAFLEKGHQPLFAHPLAPARQRRAVEGQRVPEELLAAEQLEIRVLEPALAQHLVGDIVQVLEDRQARHQPRRQGRLTGTVAVDRPAALFEKAPVDRPRQLRERMGQVHDLVEPRPEEVVLARLAPLSGSHHSPHRSLDQSMESRPSASINLPESPSTAHAIRQTRILANQEISNPLRPLAILHGRLRTDRPCDPGRSRPDASTPCGSRSGATRQKATR
jgi:hypothetical protein